MSAIADRPDMLGVVTRTAASMLKMPVEQLDADARFESFGIDSIVGMELIARLSRDFGVPITPAQFALVSTLRELAGYIETNSDDARQGATPAVATRLPPAVDAAPRITRQPPVRQAPGRRRAYKKQDAKGGFQSVLDHIRRKYAIELADRQFGSIEEIVNALVAEHQHELLLHYEELPESGAGTAETEAKGGMSAEASDADPAGGCDIAIVGIGCRFPDASDHRVFWSNLISEKNSIREIPGSRWSWRDHYDGSASPGKTISKWGALLDDIDCFDADFFGVAPQEAQFLDPQERLLHEETYRAFQDAGIDVGQLSGSSTGVFVGYEYSEYEQCLRTHAHRFPGAMAYSSSSTAYYLANRLSYTFDLCGPSEAFNVNCASSAVAINRACYSLVNRESDLAVAAGVSLNLFPDDYIAETQYGLLSPDGTCAVFDNDANGYTRGEGVGVLVLKRLADAIKDNSTIYGVVKSCHQSNRGRANSVSDIKHEAITSVMRDCYAKASIDPDRVSYVELDGYATRWGDSFEFEGVKNVFAGAPGEKYCALGSLKGNIGHLEPASGIASVIKVALALHNKKFPATVTKRKTSEFIDLESDAHPLYFAETSIPFESIRREGEPIRAGVNSFSDSGCNIHILLEEYIPRPLATRQEEPPAQQLFVVSARDRSRLDAYLGELVRSLSSVCVDVPLGDIAYTLQTGREAMRDRLAICAASKGELLGKIATFQDRGARKPAELEANGIYYSDSGAGASNPLAGVITPDMVSGLVERCRESRQWQQVAVLWVNGVSIPWRRIWEGQRVQSVPLPAYQFAKDRYWFDMQAPVGVAGPAGDSNQRPVEAGSAWPEAGGVAQGADGCAPEGAVGKLVLLLQQELALQLQKPVSMISTARGYLELGVTSLDVISLVERINGLLGIRSSPSLILKYPDIQQLAAHLVEIHPEKVESLFAVDQEPSVPWPGPAPVVEGEPPIQTASDDEVAGSATGGAIDEQWILEKVRWQGSLGDGDTDYEKVTF